MINYHNITDVFTTNHYESLEQGPSQCDSLNILINFILTTTIITHMYFVYLSLFSKLPNFICNKPFFEINKHCKWLFILRFNCKPLFIIKGKKHRRMIDISILLEHF